ncbi:MAG: OmpH family outer membrane protein [bacterium]
MNKRNEVVAMAVTLVFTLLVFGGPLVSSALSQELGKVGVVDVLKVYNEWDVQKKADAEFQPKRQKLQDQDKEITKKKDELRKLKSVSSAEKVAKQEAEIKAAERDLRDQVESLSEEIDKKAKDLTKELDGKLQKIYKDLADKEGYTIIFEKRAIRYSKSDMDLTKKITELLNSMEAAAAPAEPEKSKPAVKSEPAPSTASPTPKKAK